jgi:DNA helicase HerA-like ATPase
MALLLINIGVYTKNNQLGDGRLKNIIMIDEAHVLLGGGSSSNPEGADSQGATIKSLQDMIAEIRSYGTGIIIADQSPTKVSREVVANTDIKIS